MRLQVAGSAGTRVGRVRADVGGVNPALVGPVAQGLDQGGGARGVAVDAQIGSTFVIADLPRTSVARRS